MEKEPIEPEVIEEKIDETPGGDDPQAQLAEMAAKLEIAEATLKVKAQEDRQRSIDKIIKANEASWLDYLLTKIDSDISLEDIEEIASTIHRATAKPIQIGEPLNFGSQHNTERAPQSILKEAETKAKQSGRPEDRAAFSVLKQKLFGGNK